MQEEFLKPSQNQHASVLPSPPHAITLALLLSASVLPALSTAGRSISLQGTWLGGRRWNMDGGPTGRAGGKNRPHCLKNVYFAKLYTVLQDFVQLTQA